MTSRAPDPARRALLLSGVAALASVFAGACTAVPGLRLGLLAGLAGRGAGLGESGRNGALLAVEARNAAGGVGGQPVTLQVEDDGQNPDQARSALQRLVDAGVDAVIGPFTSAMAQAVLPLAEQTGLLLLSPTVTSMALVGRDDMLLRINRTTRDNAGDYAQRLIAAGHRRAAVAHDDGNRSFAQSWLDEFRHAFVAAGGAVVEALPFEPGGSAATAAVVDRLQASGPDVGVLIANAVDAARLAQLWRQRAPTLSLAVAEWAATDNLIELGGRAVEGALVLQPLNRDSRAPAYLAFVADYRQRFGGEPSYGAVAAHDAATVLMAAAGRRSTGQTMKAAVLGNGPYAGLQQAVNFDGNGDGTRQVIFTEVRDGRFRPLP